MYKLLLYGIAILLKYASRNNIAFRKYVGNINLSIAIKTQDNKGRTFIFKNGRVTSSSNLKHYDAALVFSDSKTAFKVLKAGKQDAVFEAAAKGKLYIEGMAIYIQWFNDVINIALHSKDTNKV
jgi:hypothetical protein